VLELELDVLVLLLDAPALLLPLDGALLVPRGTAVAAPALPAPPPLPAARCANASVGNAVRAKLAVTMAIL
jgi:hypothetical protein